MKCGEQKYEQLKTNVTIEPVDMGACVFQAQRNRNVQGSD